MIEIEASSSDGPMCPRCSHKNSIYHHLERWGNLEWNEGITSYKCEKCSIDFSYHWKRVVSYEFGSGALEKVRMKGGSNENS